MRGAARRGGGVYSGFVRFARVAFPLAALAMMGVVVLRLSRPADMIRQVQTAPVQGEAAPGASELIAARYEGVDERGRPYTLIADRATRLQDAEETISMRGLKADMTLEDKSWVSLESPQGDYAIKGQSLTLPSDVTVHHDSGYALRLEGLRIDLKARTAVSAKPVSAQGPMGELEAAGLDITNAGDLIVFTGPLKARLRLKGV